MITEKDFEDKERIEEDKDAFRNLALIRGFELSEINDFLVEFYQNLKPFSYNLKELKKLKQK